MVNALSFSKINGNYNLITNGSANALGSFIADSLNWTTNSGSLTTPTWSFILGNSTSISSNATVQNLTISTGETVTIPAGKQLTVNGTISNNAGTGGLVISSDASGTGSLIHNTNFVPATVNRYITGSGNSWHLISSPASMTIAGSNFTPSGSGYDFYTWYEPTADWVNIKNSTVEPTWATANGPDFIPGRGYLCAWETANPTHQFQGILNNGTISCDLTATSGAFAGNNLIGNPYPCAIDWKSSSGWSRTPLANSGSGYDFYVWNDASGNYGVFNSAGTTGTNGTTRYIPSGQGFFVLAASSGTLSMTNDVRVGSQNPSFLKSGEDPLNVLKLRVSGDENPYSDEVVIEFGHENSTGGTPKWSGMYSNAPEFYTVSGDNRYSICMLGTPSPQTVDLALAPGMDGAYKITASLTESFSPGTVILLEDKKTGQTQNLMSNPEYTFSALKNDDPGRFIVRFGGSIGIPEASSNKVITIYASGSELFIVSNLNNNLTGTVELRNMLGQTLLYKQLDGSPLLKISLHQPAGYYLVRVIAGDQSATAKVMLK
jgi:hypothetical protein